MALAQIPYLLGAPRLGPVVFRGGFAWGVNFALPNAAASEGASTRVAARCNATSNGTHPATATNANQPGPALSSDVCPEPVATRAPSTWPMNQALSQISATSRARMREAIEGDLSRRGAVRGACR